MSGASDTTTNTTPLTAPRPPGRWGRRLATGGAGCIVLVLAASVLFLIVASVPDPLAFAVSVLLAVVPATLYALLVLRLDRYEREPGRALIAAFGWGAIGAVFFSVISSLIFSTILATAVTDDANVFLSAAIGAPLVEETCKGIALLAVLLFFRHELDNVLDGLIYGALIDLGFAMTENILYFGAEYLEHGVRGLGTLFVARAIIDGFGHAAYTATTGAAIGWTRRQYRQGGWRFVVPLLGWGLAVFQHFLWNTGLFVIGAVQGAGTSTLSLVLIEAPLVILPAVAMLVVIARAAGRRELATLREQLAPEVAGGVVSATDYRTLTDPGLRRGALRETERRGGRALRRRQERFFQVAAELAFRKYHLARGERPKPGQLAPEEAYRQELISLRAELAGGQSIDATSI